MRDYAKKSRPIKRQRQSDGAWILVVLIVCAIFYLGYMGYHFLHKELLQEEQKLATDRVIKPSVIKSALHKKPIKTVKKVKKKIKTKNVALNPADIQPKYDFYQLLPETTVKISKMRIKN